MSQIHFVLGNAAADGGDVGRVERGVAGVAAEHAEDADALVRAHRGALPLDGVHGARDGGGEADAVLGVADVVVHRLGDRDHLHALPVELRGVAQRIVAADGDQVIQVQRLDVLQHRLGDVEDRGGHALLGGLLRGKSCPSSTGGSFFIFDGIGARTVQIGAAGAVDGAGVLAIQRQHVARAARRILQVDVRQSFPAAADADHLAADFAAPVNHRLDDGIQSRNVAAAGEDADTLRSHDCSSSNKIAFRLENLIIKDGVRFGGGFQTRTRLSEL